MLDVSHSASEAINALATTAGTLEHGGLRISVATKSEHGADLALAVADRPLDGDQVVLGALGSRVFLEPEAAQYLTDKVLDVQHGNDKKYRFTVRSKV